MNLHRIPPPTSIDGGTVLRLNSQVAIQRLFPPKNYFQERPQPKENFQRMGLSETATSSICVLLKINNFVFYSTVALNCVLLSVLLVLEQQKESNKRRRKDDCEKRRFQTLQEGPRDGYLPLPQWLQVLQMVLLSFSLSF